MRTELVRVKGRGMCLLISGIPFTKDGEVDMRDIRQYCKHPFTDVSVIAAEIEMKRKIAAIKECRAQTGWGLKEAKEYIDKYYPMGIDYEFDYEGAADKFVRDHSVIKEAFLKDDEMVIE